MAPEYSLYKSIFPSSITANTVSIKLKIDYLKEKGLGGVMFLEYTDDYESQLLDAIYHNLN